MMGWLIRKLRRILEQRSTATLVAYWVFLSLTAWVAWGVVVEIVPMTIAALFTSGNLPTRYAVGLAAALGWSSAACVVGSTFLLLALAPASALESRYSPRIFVRMAAWSNARLFVLWTILSIGVPVLSSRANSIGWEVATRVNRDGIGELARVDAIGAIVLGVASVFAITTLAYLAAESVRRFRNKL